MLSRHPEEESIIATKVTRIAASGEQAIVDLFSPGETFTLNGDKFVVEYSGKPRVAKGRGESKTDIYISSRTLLSGIPLQLKISYKRTTAHFIENKMNAERFHDIVKGDQVAMSSILAGARERLDRTFTAEKARRSGETIYTLGYRADLMRVPGNGYIPWNPSPGQLIDIYGGTSIPDEKKHSILTGFNDGQPVQNSGVASHILMGDSFTSLQDAVNQLIPIPEYVAAHPDVYFALKAVNYRVEKDKWDGNRALFLHVKWEKSADGNIEGRIDFSQVFAATADPLGKHLRTLLQ